ncbi:3-hydroxyacyl-CoA dehydrogenase [Propionivibrio sp.]|uniref:3-hydroxyacyl-CoA dehydrogenase n=1 Tax=Propionivibrio sp. TaxID=2212460 RepID=UPI0025F34598|nr:3-hydroxyacyl-CoA dehydrogenase [Propionivibrio sp.]MBK8744433.1 3-hydroxyacyl-CoA dehydrogenase [Propionivibrio sp.]
MQIENSVFLVTGAGSGLGAATARMVVGAGGRVLLADVNRQGGEALAEELGERACFAHTDVTDEASAQNAVDLAVARFGTIHGLVTCAGIAPAEKVVGRDGPHRLESFIKVVQVNLIGVFNVLRLAASVMCRNEPDANGERGVIINTASISAYEGQIGQAAYGASKGGVVGMTLPIARELCRSGIRVNTIAPGVMETPMVLSMPAEVQESLGKMVPFPPRLGKPSEFAALVRHIAENTYINGEVIRIDGAIRMGAK